MLEELETNEINGSIENHNDETIGDQPIVRNNTIPIEEHLISLRCSGRVIRQPNQYMGIGDTLVTISDDSKDAPHTLSDAMKDVNSKSWQKEMNYEMDSVYSNQVW